MSFDQVVPIRFRPENPPSPRLDGEWVVMHLSVHDIDRLERLLRHAAAVLDEHVGQPVTVDPKEAS